MSVNTPFKQRMLTIGFIILGVIVTVFFGMRVLHAFKKFDGRRPPPPGKVETDVELIRGWMTVPFIAKTYHVPDGIIFDELNIPEKGNMEKSLKELNEEYYPDQTGYVMKAVMEIVQTHLPPPHTAPEPPTTPAP